MGRDPPYELLSLDLATRATRSLRESQTEWMYSPTIAPDGGALAFERRAFHHDLCALDPQ